jgi:molybdate transport system substrate-binding protein
MVERQGGWTMINDKNKSGTRQGNGLNIFAAAALETPLNVVIEKFQKCKQVTVTPNYGASGSLYELIERGVHCDVYYPADWNYIEKLEQENRLVTAKRFLTTNAVLVVSEAAKSKIRSIADIVHDGVTVAISSPKAPIGPYSERALKELGLWNVVSAKGPLLTRPASVHGVAKMVKFGEVDAGIVFSTVARAFELKEVETLSQELTGEIVFGVGVLHGANEDLAQKFMDATFHHIDEFLMLGWQISKNGGWETCRKTLSLAARAN